MDRVSFLIEIALAEDLVRRLQDYYEFVCLEIGEEEINILIHGIKIDRFEAHDLLLNCQMCFVKNGAVKPVDSSDVVWKQGLMLDQINKLSEEQK